MCIPFLFFEAQNCFKSTIVPILLYLTDQVDEGLQLMDIINSGSNRGRDQE